MKSSMDILQGYVSDMMAVEKHILGAVEQQMDDSRVKSHSEAHGLLARIAELLRSHTTILEGHLSSTEVKSIESLVKKAATTVTGIATGLYDKIRGEDAVTRNLRDDYTALNMAAISYTALHTTALAHQSPVLADLSLKHLKELTPLIMELSRVIPSVIVRELTVEGKAVDPSVAEQAVANTQNAWVPEAYQ